MYIHYRFGCSLDLDSDGFSLDFYLLMIKLNNKLEKCM